MVLSLGCPGFLEGLAGIIEARLEKPVEVIFIKKREFLIDVMHKSSSRLFGLAQALKCGGTVSSELVVLSQILGCVLIELEKAGWVVLDIGIAKVVQLLTQCFLHVLDLLGGVLLLVNIKLARCGLELVGLSSGVTLGDELVNTALHVGAFEVLVLEKEGHETQQSLLGLAH